MLAKNELGFKNSNFQITITISYSVIKKLRHTPDYIMQISTHTAWSSRAHWPTTVQQAPTTFGFPADGPGVFAYN